jgi:dipeptidyl-peptidase-4
MNKNIYKQADKFFPWNLQSSVLNCTIFPYWSKEDFYYFSQTPSGRVFKKIHCQNGASVNLFHEKNFLELLSNQLNEKIALTDIPLDRISILENPVRLAFNFKKKNWQYDLKKNIFLDEKDENNNQLLSPNKNLSLKIDKHNIYIEDTSSSEVIQITHDGERYHDYATSPETNTKSISMRIKNITLPPIAIWSPDSKKLITHKIDQRNVFSLNLLQNAPDDTHRPISHEYKMSFSGDENVPLVHLLIIDAEKKEMIPVIADPLLAPYLTAIEFNWVWWSNDSNDIFYLNESRGSKDFSLCMINSSTGEVKKVLTEKAKNTFVEPSQLFLWTKQILILKKLNQVIWMSERSGYSHIYLFDIGQDTPRSAITKGAWCVREIHFYNDDDNWLYFTACGYNPKIDPYYKFLYRCRLDGSDLQCLTEENANHVIQFAPDNKYFLDTHSEINTAPITVLKSLDGKTISLIERADLNGLKKLNWVPPKRFKAKGRDGKTDVYGNLYYPSNFNPNKKYPLIDHIYPGPQVYRTPISFGLYGLIFRSPWTAQALAELGFIVLHMDGFGTPGRSKEFHDFTYQSMGDCGIPDHVSAIQELATKLHYIDINKVGVTGFSGGGYATARAMLLYPDFYKVGVAAAGNHDLRCYPASYGEKYNSLDKNTYEKQSTASLAANLKGKLLLIHGEMDDNVHPCATYQLVKALIHHNKYFDMLIMPDLNHGDTFDHPYYIRRQWDYFVQHLLNKTPPSTENYIISSFPDAFPQIVDW